MGKVDEEVAKAFVELGIDDDTPLAAPARDTVQTSAFSDAAVEARKREYAERHKPDGPVLVRATQVKVERITWLWPDWLARGKLHLLAGAPGQGKTTIALSLAAEISRGGTLPDGSRCRPGNVLVWSAEDDVGDTLLPRLLAMGADLRRIFFVQGTRQDGEIRPFDPACDLVDLSTAANELGGLALIIVDPVVSAVAGDGNKNLDVRRALQPLVTLAAALGAAVLGITHFTKGSGGRDPTERVTGSVAFGAVARVVLVAAKVKQADGDRRIFARAKTNIGPDEGGFVYEVRQAEVPGHDGMLAGVVGWGDALPGTARELLREAEQEDEDSEQTDAAKYLRELLAGGPLSHQEVKRQADASGFAWRTVQRAMKPAGVKSTTKGFGKNRETTWALAPAEPHPRHARHGFKDGADGADGATDDSCPF